MRIALRTMSEVNLLIVDKHPEVLRWIEKRLVRNQNLLIFKVNNLIDAEAKLFSDKQDILLIDPYMTEGLCIAELKKYRQQFPQLIIIILAAVIDDNDRRKFSDLEMNFVLEKRLACEKLVQTLDLAYEITISKRK